MRAFMHEEVKINNPLVVDGEVKKDKYGRHERIESLSNTRIQRTSKLVFNSDNEQIGTTIEVNIPPELKIYDGSYIEGRLQNGEPFDGRVVSIEDITSLTGNRVHYRTVFIDG